MDDVKHSWRNDLKIEQLKMIHRDSMRHVWMESHDKRPNFVPPLPFPLPRLQLKHSTMFHRQAFLFPFLYRGFD